MSPHGCLVQKAKCAKLLSRKKHNDSRRVCADTFFNHSLMLLLKYTRWRTKIQFLYIFKNPLSIWHIFFSLNNINFKIQCSMFLFIGVTKDYPTNYLWKIYILSDLFVTSTFPFIIFNGFYNTWASTSHAHGDNFCLVKSVPCALHKMPHSSYIPKYLGMGFWNDTEELILGKEKMRYFTSNPIVSALYSLVLCYQHSSVFSTEYNGISFSLLFCLATSSLGLD